MMKFDWEIRRWAPGLDEEAIKECAADHLKPGTPAYAAGGIAEFIGSAMASSYDKLLCVLLGERVEPLSKPELQEIACLLGFGWASNDLLRKAVSLLRAYQINMLAPSDVTEFLEGSGK
jgi:hypothetical protein